MTPQTERRENEALNIIAKWVMIACFPVAVTLAAKVFMLLRVMEQHMAVLEQKSVDDRVYYGKMDERLTRLENEVRDHIVYGPKRGPR